MVNLAEGEPLVSVITPVDPERSRFLSAAGDSVQELARSAPNSFAVEWIVVIDGPGRVSMHDRNPSPVVERVITLPRRYGVSVARNVAMSHASGTWVFPLDADDVIEATGFHAVLAWADANRSRFGWVSGNRVRLDGSRTAHWYGRKRPWPLASLGGSWTAPFPFHPNSVLVLRELALAVGGWPAVPVNEDIAFCLALNRIAAGYSCTEVVLRYRLWGKQIVSSPSYEAEKLMSFRLIEGIENAARSRNRLTPITAPAAGPAFGRLRPGEAGPGIWLE